MFRILLFLIIIPGYIGCMRTFNSPPAQPPTDQQKPTIDFKEPQLVWTYLKTEQAILTNNLLACPDNFTENSKCLHLNYSCFFGQNIYRCQPENSTFTYKGIVQDENGNPISNAFVYGGMAITGFNELVKSYTNQKGEFYLTIRQTCLKTIYAQKDGFQSSIGHFLSSKNINCYPEKWGNREIVIVLNKMSRSETLSNHTDDLDLCHINGHVKTPTGLPIDGVTIKSGSHSTLTNAEGMYQFKYKKPCFRICSANKNGFFHPNPLLHGHNHVSCMEGKPGDLILIER